MIKYKKLMNQVLPEKNGFGEAVMAAQRISDPERSMPSLGKTRAEACFNFAATPVRGSSLSGKFEIHQIQGIRSCSQAIQILRESPKAETDDDCAKTQAMGKRRVGGTSAAAIPFGNHFC
jgi:hypothetical protein